MLFLVVLYSPIQSKKEEASSIQGYISPNMPFAFMDLVPNIMPTVVLHCSQPGRKTGVTSCWGQKKMHLGLMQISGFASLIFFQCFIHKWKSFLKKEMSLQLFLSLIFFIYLILISDEQERVQKKTFVNWINSYLSKVIYYIFHVQDALEK